MNWRKIGNIILKILLTAGIGYISLYVPLLIYALFQFDINPIILGMASLTIPALVILIWFKKKRKLLFIIWLIYTIISFSACGINRLVYDYQESLRIDTSVNINVHEYMPFKENSNIVKLDKDASLKLESDLPILDGAAAVFPLYSAFVNAVYPENTEYGEDVFLYNNTVEGYKALAEKKTDIFFGAYPSEEQIQYAKSQGTEFEYVEIGKEGFVFFVNKDNPIDGLTSEQIRDIYSGKITNWKELGGNDEEILAFQRNEGSGSQSRLKRFMGDVPIMEARTEEINTLMVGIIEQVADYKNYSNSIGFSFRYYLDTLIANPNVKMLKVDGVAPTKENISNDSYSLTGSLYAVTYKDNDNKNVDILIDWILSEEGQELVERTGYARANINNIDNEIYKNALKDLYENHILPDGTKFEDAINTADYNMDENSFAIYDVDFDGKDELIVSFTHHPMAAMRAIIYDYDKNTGKFSEQLTEFTSINFYSNGVIEVLWSHNQGSAGDSLWPYTMYKYNKESDSYDVIAGVDAWNKSFNTQSYLAEEFPSEVDKDGDGIVYYILPEGNYNNYETYDLKEYNEWRSLYIKDETTKIDIPYLNLTMENINNI